MSRILLGWELGGGTGHLHHLAPVAQAFRRHGHEVILAVRDIATVSRFAGLKGFGLLQAPVLLRESRLPPSVNYAELLFRVGYINVNVLSGFIDAWRRLLRMVNPAFVLVEHSPTLLIAARIENVRRASIGSGFMIPPRISPMPTIQPWRAVTEARLLQSEREALARVNAAVAAHGGAPFGALFEMLDVQEHFLSTYPELDHYGPRADEQYWGRIGLSSANKPIEWPPGDGPRIFVYYRAGYPHFSEAMSQLASLALPTVVVADDATRSHISKFSTDRLRITTEPYDLRSVAASAAVAISHGAHGSVAELVGGGCPVVSLPVVIEQAQFAYRVARAGLGLTAPAKDGKPDVAGSVRRVLEDSAFAARVKAFAERHRGQDPAEQAERIARRCEESLL